MRRREHAPLLAAGSADATFDFRIPEGNIMTEKATRNFALRDAKGNEKWSLHREIAETGSVKNS